MGGTVLGATNHGAADPSDPSSLVQQWPTEYLTGVYDESQKT